MAPPDPGPDAALSAHAELVAALQRPGALPEGAGPVQVVETHLSTLLLAGDRVYKLKKPRRLDFVDFSTLARREAACREELRLNRRTAPALYRAVWPVVRTPDGPQVLAADAVTRPVIDWALAMARFDETQGFDRLAARGALGAAQVEALAGEVVRFHEALPPSPPGRGAPAVALDWARRNAAELAQLLAAEPALAARTEALARWSAARGEALVGAMAARQAAGRVREGHGDLHLGNVVWHDGAPLLFDAIEFNAALRHGDTVGDWAFTFMDLLACAGPDLAWRFASTVVEASGDHGALALLPWWGVYRALVRAKVARLGPPGAAADAAIARYLGAAEALAALQPGVGRPAPPGAPGLPASGQAPWLVLTMGLSGSGKSAVAQALLGRLAAVRLRSDVERKRLHGLAPLDRDGPARGLYSLEANRRTYDRLLALADAALAAGIGVVVDAASLRRSERAAFAALAGRRGVRHALLWCDAPEAVLRARLGARSAAGQDASDATADVLALQQRVAEWPGPDEAAPVLRLDTDGPLAEVQSRALALPWDRIAPMPWPGPTAAPIPGPMPGLAPGSGGVPG